MTARISVELCPEQDQECGTDQSKWCVSCRELVKSRALVTELRALADEMRPTVNANVQYFVIKIDSLLAAHDAQQAEGKEVEVLWCVHVIGPDDLIAAPSVEAAREAAERANKHFQALAILPGEMHFEAIRWPHSKESHAKSLVNDWPCLQPRGSAQAEGKP